MHQTLVRLGTTIALAAGILVAGTSAGVAPAQASTFEDCYTAPSNETCNGKLPWAVHGGACQDTRRTVATRTRYYDANTAWLYDITLYYSEHCRTNWAEILAFNYGRPSGIAQSHQATFRGKVRRYADGPDGEYKLVYSDTTYASALDFTDYAQSRMVYSPHNTAMACLGISRDLSGADFGNGDNDQIACTPRA